MVDSMDPARMVQMDCYSVVARALLSRLPDRYWLAQLGWIAIIPMARFFLPGVLSTMALIPGALDAAHNAYKFSPNQRGIAITVIWNIFMVESLMLSTHQSNAIPEILQDLTDLNVI